ncbi:MAG TPA: F0F1 ATP synthase subunit B [Bacteroidales bacterium]|nr:F0F1 ATP synthase subunit B [Bacteroidales bacterium]
MELVTPGLGLVVWMTLAFLILVFILGKFAWKPIMKGIDKRNQSIEDALMAAEKAKEEMVKLKADNDQILAHARIERDEMLKEARSFSERIISDAKNQAKVEIDKMKEQAKQEIALEKAGALSQIKTQVAVISIQIAEKLLRKNLDDTVKQEELINEIMQDFNLN